MSGGHIGDPNFGLDVDWNKFLGRVFKHVPKLGCVDAVQLIYNFYDTEYKIYNHAQVNNKRPLASIAFHECENVNDNSLLESVMRMYVVKSIKDIFGLSLVEYMDLPIDIVEMLNSIADKENNKKANVVNSIEKQFNQVQK